MFVLCFDMFVLLRVQDPFSDSSGQLADISAAPAQVTCTKALHFVLKKPTRVVFCFFIVVLFEPTET